MGKLTKRGEELLRTVQTNLQKELRSKKKSRFNMDTWLSVRNLDFDKLTRSPEAKAISEDQLYVTVPIPEGFCTSVGCIAGSVVVEAGWRPVMYRTFDGTLRVYNDTISNGRDESSNVESTARQLLGINRKQATLLFAPWTGYDHRPDIDDPKNPYWHGLNTSNRKHAIEAIERFIVRNRRYEA